MPPNHNFTFTSYSTGKTVSPKNITQLKKYLKSRHTIIGNLRSYGDTCIGSNSTHISLKNFSKILNLDEKKNIVEVESGILLKDLFSYLLKKNLVIECLPGCKFVTIGGMIANNIHGKLIKENSFIHNIISIKIIDKNFKIIKCSRQKNREKFFLAIGGKGLTGPIISTKLKLEKLPSKTIKQKTYRFDTKKKFLEKIKNLKNFKYAVTWLDFTRKNFTGILFSSNYSNVEKKINSSKDFSLPYFIINLISFFSTSKYFIYFFNKLFKLKNTIFPKVYDSMNNYFFPQNRILNWNSVYKKYGFVQLHFYLNTKQLHLIEIIKNDLLTNNIYSNFAVIKFHEKKKFVQIKNLSLSIDIPLNQNIKKIVKILNDFVNKYNLQVNLSKDIILKNLNNKTHLKNQIFVKKNSKYLMKNKTSKMLERLNNVS